MNLNARLRLCYAVMFVPFGLLLFAPAPPSEASKGERALSSNGCNFIGCNYSASKSDSNDGDGESGGKAIRLQSFSVFGGYSLAD